MGIDSVEWDVRLAYFEWKTPMVFGKQAALIELCTMRKLSLIVMVFLFALTVFAQDLPEEWICKERGQVVNRLQRRSNSGVKHGYMIDYNRCKWWVNPLRGAYFKGDVVAHFTVIGNTDSLGFDFAGNLAVTEVYGKNQVILNYRRSGNYMYVYKPGGWKAGERDSVGIRYQGNPSNGGGFGYFVYDNHMKGPIVHTLSQPYGAQYWWPCKQSLQDKIDSLDVWVYTDTSMKAASNGLLARNDIINDTTRLMVWKHRYPIVTYLVAIAVTNYKEFTLGANLVGRTQTLPVLNYVFPQFYNSAQQEIPAILPILRLYDSLFIRYPFEKEKYGHAQFTWGGGMEHQTMSFMVNFSFDLMAHELAHQWFGDMVTCGSWRDLWLNEGFATYLTAISFEYLKPKSDWYRRLKGMRGDVTGKDDGSVFPTDTLNVGNLFNGRLTYNKGAWVLHMLRDKIGDSAFFKGCRQYLLAAGNAYGFANTKGLQTQMELASGRKLDTFFQQWYYGQGFPYLKINWKQRGDELSLAMEQIPSDPSVPFWHVRVPLLFRGNGKDTLIHWEASNLKEGRTLKLNFQVDTVIFDPNVKLLAKASIGGMNLNHVQKEAFIITPNPAVGDVKIYSRNATGFFAEVYNALGQQIWQSNSIATPVTELLIPSASWRSGPYFIRINDDNFVYLYKLIKQ